MSSQGYEEVGTPAGRYVPRKLIASEVGLGAPRQCTDLPALFFFALMWALLIAVASSAVAHGDLSRLIDGVDYLGNVCGRGTPSDVDAAVKETWSQRTFLFFPVAFDPVHALFNADQALNFGVCLPACPPQGASIGQELYGPMASQLSSFTVQFASSVHFHRCVPSFNSFNCTTSQCTTSRERSQSRFSAALDLNSFALRSFAELTAHWWVILLSAIFAIVVSFVWMFVLRRIIRPVVVATLIAGFALLIVLGGVFYYRRTQTVNVGGTSSQWYLAAAILTWLASFLYLCVGVYIYRDVIVACDIIEEASRIPLALPSMLTVPPITVCFLVPVTLFFAFMAAEIYTSAYLAHSVQSMTFFPGSGGQNVTNITTAAFRDERWQTYAQLFNVFGFLWTIGFANAVCFMVVSFGAVFWYWSVPGSEKTTDHGIIEASRLTVMYHLGSLALGSLIIAVIQTIRLIMSLFEKRARRYLDRNDPGDPSKFLLCCLHCCLAYFERIVQFISKNAYVVQCMTGEAFLPAAQHALHLLMRNALSVGAVNIVGEFVMIIGKLLITCLATLLAYAILSSAENADDASSGMFLIIIVIAMMSYFVAAVFVNVFGVCIDTVLLSYCYDLEQHNGRDSPYYFPDSLTRHLERAEKRQKEREIRRQMDLQ